LTTANSVNFLPISFPPIPEKEYAIPKIFPFQILALAPRLIPRKGLYHAFGDGNGTNIDFNGPNYAC
jgi:hypothetical protein